MDYQIVTKSDICELHLSGELTFSDNVAFREVIEELKNTSSPTIEIDFAKLTYIDSAGLGLLVLLFEEAKDQNRSIAIRNIQGDVKRIMEVARFEEIVDVKASG